MLKLGLHFGITLEPYASQVRSGAGSIFGLIFECAFGKYVFEIGSHSGPSLGPKIVKTGGVQLNPSEVGTVRARVSKGKQG